MTSVKEWMKGELRTASAKVSEDTEKHKELLKTEVASQKHDLEERFNQANDQMIAALQKVAQVEGGVLPNLELRFNKFEATLAQMDALMLSLVATTSAHAELLKPSVSGASLSGAAAPEGGEDRPVPGTPVREVPVYPMSPDPMQSKGVWPSPEEAAAAAIVAADPELKKHVWERKGFDKRLSKFSNELGEKEFKDWAYELRRVTGSDLHFHSYLRWLEEAKLEDTKGKVTLEVLKNQAVLTGWNVVRLNAELYGILAEATKGRAKGAVMAREQDTHVNGSELYREWAVEHLDGSKKATVALGVKITDPAMASLEELEDRLRAWDLDKERYERLAEQKVGELAFIHLQKMMPAEVKAKWDNEKHNYTKVSQLRDFYARVIEDHKASGGIKRKPRTINELSAEIEASAAAQEGAEIPEEGNLLYSLLCHASDEDIAKVLPPAELLTFVRWRQKGGKSSGKGGAAGGRNGGKGGWQNQQSGASRTQGNPGSAGAGASTSGAGSGKGSFEGECGFCHEYGHRKADCKKLDEVMAARRAAGQSPPRGGGGKGYGGKGGAQNGGGGAGGKGINAFGQEFAFLDMPSPQNGGPFGGSLPPQGPPAMPGWGGHTAAMQWGPSNTTTWGGPTAGMYGGPLRCILRVDPSLQPEELPISEVKSKPFTDANPFDPLRSSDEEDDSSDGESVADLTSDVFVVCRCLPCRHQMQMRASLAVWLGSR